MTMTSNNIELYARQFENKNKLIGQTVRQVIFYLEGTDKDFTEQPNEFDKSLLNGIEKKTDDLTFSIGNRYSNLGYGLSIDPGQTNELEYFDELKEPIKFDTLIIGQTLRQVNIYWMNIPFEDEKGLYPQEIELITDNGYLLTSSIEINIGEVNTEFTNELLIIDNKEVASRLKLGQFGLIENERKIFRNLVELTESEQKNGL